MAALSLTITPVVAQTTKAQQSGSAQPTGKDAQLEQRVNAMAAELRCLVCQNQTIADSSADLAVDLKNQIREKLRAGSSEAEIIYYMVARYGDFVLYRPPFKLATALLWTGPFALALLGLFMLWRNMRGRGTSSAETPLSDAERSRAQAILAAHDTPPGSRKGDMS